MEQDLCGFVRRLQARIQNLFEVPVDEVSETIVEKTFFEGVLVYTAFELALSRQSGDLCAHRCKCSCRNPTARGCLVDRQ